MNYLPAVVAVVTIVVSVPLAMGKVPMNWFYGFRTPRTMRDASIWYPANRFAAQAMIAAGVATLLVWSGLELTATDATVLSAGMSVYLLLMAWAVVASFLRLRRL